MTAKRNLHALIVRICCIWLPACLPLWMQAQTIPGPGNTSLEKKWLKSGKYDMICYGFKGSDKIPVSAFSIEVKATGQTLAVYTSLLTPQSDERWIDTSIADAGTLKPLYRSSSSPGKEFALKYGAEVSGHYTDKKTGKKKEIRETVTGKYFDSYMYPYLLGLLPLAQGYRAELPVYDYKPEQSNNIKQVRIEEVKSNVYVSELTGSHKVWQVSVHEPFTNDRYEYYIDKDTRRIWKVDFVTQGQRILMIDQETDYNPFKNKFDKEATLKMVKSGNAAISGTVFAKDNENEGLLKGMAVLNVNKKQYARNGTSVVLIPYTPFFKE